MLIFPGMGNAWYSKASFINCLDILILNTTAVVINPNGKKTGRHGFQGKKNAGVAGVFPSKLSLLLKTTTCKALVEAIYTTTRVKNLLLARKKWVAVAAYINS